MIRFNSKKKFNVPFCRKTKRFAQSYVTKIVNQIAQFQNAFEHYQWKFVCQDFEKTIDEASKNDLIYCDPPYLGRHVDYFDSWSQEDEQRLLHALTATKAKFILSTWHSNQYRENEALKTTWSSFHTITKEHFYHVGAKESNRKAILEALVLNFPPPPDNNKEIKQTLQPLLFDC